MAGLISVKSISIPVTMIGSIIGGSAWLQATRSDLDHLTEKVQVQTVKLNVIDKLSRSQDERLSRMEGKQDLILESIRRLNNRMDK
tara:strand:+ start:1190 stop:1447 length:258 start_codon:yes stop_codon:yes gene_type:complete